MLLAANDLPTIITNITAWIVGLQERRKALAQLVDLRNRPVAKQRMRWVVADTYCGIERAQLVVVNIATIPKRTRRSPAGQGGLATQRHRRDGPARQPSPDTAVVANLAQPTDPGTKKALARTRRVIRPNG